MFEKNFKSWFDFEKKFLPKVAMAPEVAMATFDNFWQNFIFKMKPNFEIFFKNLLASLQDGSQIDNKPWIFSPSLLTLFPRMMTFDANGFLKKISKFGFILKKKNCLRAPWQLW